MVRRFMIFTGMYGIAKRYKFGVFLDLQKRYRVLTESSISIRNKQTLDSLDLKIFFTNDCDLHGTVSALSCSALRSKGLFQYELRVVL